MTLPLRPDGVDQTRPKASGAPLISPINATITNRVSPLGPLPQPTPQPTGGATPPGQPYNPGIGNPSDTVPGTPQIAPVNANMVNTTFGNPQSQMPTPQQQTQAQNTLGTPGGVTGASVGQPLPAQPPAYQPIDATITDRVPQQNLGPLNQFGPGDNLIGTQINPLANNRLQGTQNAVNSAAQSLGDFGLQPFQGVGTPGFDDSQLTDLRQQLMDQLGTLQGPDRGQLASDALALFDEQQGDTRKRGIQDIGRAGARLGRLGSGMVTTDLGNLEDRLDVNRSRLQRGLANDVAQRTLDDRLQSLGALSGVSGQVGRLAGQQFGQDQSLRQETRGEREANLGFQQADLGNRLAQLGALGGLEGQQFGQGLTQRNELRGERGYQQGLDQQALQNRMQQMSLEEALMGGQFGRDMDINQLLAGLGFGGDSGFADLGAAQQFSNQANASTGTAGYLADILGQVLGQQDQNKLPQQQSAGSGYAYG